MELNGEFLMESNININYLYHVIVYIFYAGIRNSPSGSILLLCELIIGCIVY